MRGAAHAEQTPGAGSGGSPHGTRHSPSACASLLPALLSSTLPFFHTPSLTFLFPPSLPAALQTTRSSSSLPPPASPSTWPPWCPPPASRCWRSTHARARWVGGLSGWLAWVAGLGGGWPGGGEAGGGTPTPSSQQSCSSGWLPLGTHPASCRLPPNPFAHHVPHCQPPPPSHPPARPPNLRAAVCARQGVQGLPHRQLSHPVQLRRLRPRRRLPRRHPRGAGGWVGGRAGACSAAVWLGEAGRGVGQWASGRCLASRHGALTLLPAAPLPAHPTHSPTPLTHPPTPLTTHPPGLPPSPPPARPLRRSASPAAASSTSTAWGAPPARAAPAAGCCCSCPRSSTSCASSRVGGIRVLTSFVVGWECVLGEGAAWGSSTPSASCREGAEMFPAPHPTTTLHRTAPDQACHVAGPMPAAAHPPTPSRTHSLPTSLLPLPCRCRPAPDR